VRQVSSAGRGGVDPRAFLERVCVTVADAFEFDSVTALRFHPGGEEVTEIAAARGLPAEGRRSIVEAPLLVQAWETQRLVISGGEIGDATSAFALPLVSDDRCLGFLCGDCRSTVSSNEAEALATVGVVAATLLDNALARQEAQQLDVLKSEFIALAAHELRNPLSSIYGLSITLDEHGEALAESDRLALREALREQTARMRNLIEQLLDLSRFDLKAIQVTPKRLFLRPKIEELVRTIVPAREEVEIAVPPDLEAAVDPIALDRMLSNLIANALRHGEPPVTVMAAQRDTHLRLAVEDRGQGVRREFVPRLFDRFSRSTESSRGRTEGSGLGLAIARAYARAHGGDIVYEPAEPHGARFELVIPLRAPERDKAHRSR
jgi:signal transduction histidine kinase